MVLRGSSEAKTNDIQLHITKIDKDVIAKNILKNTISRVSFDEIDLDTYDMYFTAKYNMQSYVGHGYEVIGTKEVRQL